MEIIEVFKSPDDLKNYINAKLNLLGKELKTIIERSPARISKTGVAINCGGKIYRIYIEEDNGK